LIFFFISEISGQNPLPFQQIFFAILFHFDSEYQPRQSSRTNYQLKLL
jgi:hypothetical protein